MMSENESVEALSGKIDKTNELLEELLTVQKEAQARQKKCLFIMLPILVLCLMYLFWSELNFT